ncbi:protein IMPACT isoform X1 [Octopus sinensis]|nr:protein IMPACT isoform X1 [Octopus sinensis]
MDVIEDNLTRQVDEIEALTAIYGDDWRVVNSTSRIYSIQITDGQDDPKWKLGLQVQMPEDYPSISPPQYQLSCPWIRGEERTQIENQLQEIYLDNLGECIIFKWVEEIRNILAQKTDDSPIHTYPDVQLKNVTLEEPEETKDFNFDIEADIEEDFVNTKNVGAVGCPVIHHGEPMTEKRSTFQAHLAPVTHKCQVNMVMEKLLENKKVANATHNIMAYRILPSDSNIVIQGCDDDGEVHAGSRMLHLLQIIEATNLIVVISRWFGGILLGPDRFKFINNCARQICDQHGYIKVKQNENKHSRKSKKTK